MRVSNTQLPTAKELREILAGESQRKTVRYDFLAKHPELFMAYKAVAVQAQADVRWINEYTTMSLETIGLMVAESTEQIARYVISGACERRLMDELFAALYVHDEPITCDALFVFGSPANGRIAHAVELYQQGVAPLLVVSGKGPHYRQDELSEAERMAQYAIDHGVPAAAIMIEPMSITLPDNVKRTLDLWESEDFHPQTMCIVANSYISRRATMEWYKFTPWNIRVISLPAPAQMPELARDSWFVSERGVHMLLNEYAKMVFEYKMDLLRR